MKYIPIVVAFTPNYVIPAVTTILSILSNSQATDRYQIICLLTEDLPKDIQTSLLNWEEERLEFVFINLSGKLEGIYIDERYTAAASYRLLLPEILPSYKSVIYLDCDVIVRTDIAKLYRDTDLEDYYLAAVYEATLDFQIPYLKEIGCKPGEYINSGFLIINLEQMRLDNIMPSLISTANNANSAFPDQDALNIVCKGNILGLPPIYNSIRTYFLPQYKTDFLKYYTDKDWDHVQISGNIHYTGSKPWNGYTIEFVTWWSYYEQLPDFIKKIGSVKSKVRFFGKILSYTIARRGFVFIQSMYRKFK